MTQSRCKCQGRVSTQVGPPKLQLWTAKPCEDPRKHTRGRQGLGRLDGGEGRGLLRRPWEGATEVCETRGPGRARAGLGARPGSRRTGQSPIPRPARRSRKCRDWSRVEAPPLPPAQDILGVVVAVLSSKTPFHRSEPDPTRSATRPGLGHLQRGWWAGRGGPRSRRVPGKSR